MPGVSRPIRRVIRARTRCATRASVFRALAGRSPVQAVFPASVHKPEPAPTVPDHRRKAGRPPPATAPGFPPSLHVSEYNLDPLVERPDVLDSPAADRRHRYPPGRRQCRSHRPRLPAPAGAPAQAGDLRRRRRRHPDPHPAAVLRPAPARPALPQGDRRAPAAVDRHQAAAAGGGGRRRHRAAPTCSARSRPSSSPTR